jgi:plasmid stability protein
MAQILVRKLDERLKGRLQRRAKRHGRSMEAEAREILCEALREKEPQRGLGSEIVAMFSGSGIGLEKGEEIQEWRGFPVKPIPFDE